MSARNYNSSSAIEVARYDTLRGVLKDLSPYFSGKQVLDFGASRGLSAVALVDFGASSVIGVEPEEARVRESEVKDSRITLLHVADTSILPFENSQFGVVLCNAVLEHIPQPRAPYIREMWRVLAPGGYLIINETPNKYLPWDYHTTKLPLINWLPKEWARKVSVALGKWSEGEDWDHSGWRGLGQHELFASLEKFSDVSPRTCFRHRLIGQLLDPYPTWVLQKL